MKISAKQYAQSLYEVIADAKGDGEVKVAVKNFVKVLAARRALSKAEKIIKEFSDIWNKEQGVVEGELVSARELNSEIVALLHSYMAKILAVKKVKLTNQIDKNILGGFIVKIGDTVVDGSVKNQLQHLKNQLAQ